jgi:RNA polymerase sigma-70 factor (ECF subfamily)
MAEQHPHAIQETTIPADETALVDALRRGDEGAFGELVDRHHALLVRVAMFYVGSRDVAEDVAQETWLGVLRGLDRFEGRSSLKTWIFRILVNRARTRSVRDARLVPFSALRVVESDGDEPAVNADRFRGAEAGRLTGHWANRPRDWDTLPEERFLAGETLALIRAAINTLPPTQREVIVLRDIEGWSSAEVCNILEISETNQRVLLHRARSKVRRALEQHIGESEGE